jgi:hypothetical protein
MKLAQDVKYAGVGNTHLGQKNQIIAQVISRGGKD